MHPFERWFGASLSPLFRVSLALTLAETVVLSRLGSALKNEIAPLGIISFELAGTRAPEVLASFSEAVRRDALLLQGLDYLYLLLYSTAIASAALLLGRRILTARPRLAALARPVAWMQTAAACFDAIENVPLVSMLRSGHADPAGASIAQLSAIAKFALVAIGLVYVLVGAALARFGQQVGQQDGGER